MNVYATCPVTETEHFTLRLIREEDAPDLFRCYHDREAVKRMNDDNCIGGFYAETQEQVLEAIRFWLRSYDRREFVRLSIVERATGEVIGTVEGFGGETGVLRLDIASAYEQTDILAELLTFAQENFRTWFGNDRLVTKAIPAAGERRAALKACGWTFGDQYRTYRDYFNIELT